MNVLAYGGGTNSTAMLIGLRNRGVYIDLIMFADTGGERPETYDYVFNVMNPWLIKNGYPKITPVYYNDKNGNRMTLEDECLKSHTLPSLAYGFKKCSLKHKKAPQDKYCNNYQPCKDVWANGDKVNKYIGYDADEYQRRQNAIVSDIQDKKYKYIYPMVDEWEWDRDKCIDVIVNEGLPVPGKSSCFFCPAMKKNEIRQLYGKHRDLYDRAIAIEDNAQDYLISVAGLGRNWSWRDFVEAERSEIVMCDMFVDVNMPCSCYDG